LFTKCRICKTNTLENVMDLGQMYLSGRFPSKSEVVSSYPVVLTKCYNCSLVQLGHDYPLNDMYGDFYGYESSLNPSMIEHLKANINSLKKYVSPNGCVLDIGSNDGTSLGFYADEIEKVGVDPSGKRFVSQYPINSKLIPTFFDKETVKEFKNSKTYFDVVTSFAMFYDLPDPVDFAKNIEAILSDNGVWSLEQSYLPTMINQNAFDTICHEHIEYYCFSNLELIFKKSGLKALDVQLNNTNGGSFKVLCCKESSSLEPNRTIAKFKAEEKQFFSNINIYENFKSRVENLKVDLNKMIKKLKNQGKKVYGLGASTKGNVLLQYFGLNNDYIDAIGEINQSKFGKYTPGTMIPIVDQNDILTEKNACFIVLPWHFADFFQNAEKFKDVHLIFPLPKIEVFNEKK
jgi:NDP-4-keto-2,6-dideoxyhexose 3-C-methyltransferase